MRTLYLSYCEVRNASEEDPDVLDIRLPGEYETVAVPDGMSRDDYTEMVERRLESMLGGIPEKVQNIEIDGAGCQLFWLDRPDTRYVVTQLVQGALS